MRVRHIIICGLPRTTKDTIFEREKLLTTKCLFWLSLQFCLVRFHSKKNWARFDQKCTLDLTWSARYSCPILMELEFPPRSFKKYWNIKFHENQSSRIQVVSMRTDGRTDMAKLIVAFRNFANAPKTVRLFRSQWVLTKCFLIFSISSHLLLVSFTFPSWASISSLSYTLHSYQLFILSILKILKFFLWQSIFPWSFSSVHFFINYIFNTLGDKVIINTCILLYMCSFVGVLKT